MIYIHTTIIAYNHTYTYTFYFLLLSVCTCHPCLFKKDFLAAIMGCVGFGSKKVGRISCGMA